jgi:hypothetical protein
VPANQHIQQRDVTSACPAFKAMSPEIVTSRVKDVKFYHLVTWEERNRTRKENYAFNVVNLKKLL